MANIKSDDTAGHRADPSPSPDAPTTRRAQTLLTSYLLALAVTGATLLLSFAVGPLRYREIGYLLFVFPIVLSASIGGFGPGALASIAAAALLAVYPPGTDASPGRITLATAGVLFGGICASALTARLRRTAGRPQVNRLHAGMLIAAACVIVIVAAVYRTIEQEPAHSIDDRRALRLTAALHGLEHRSLEAERAAAGYALSGDPGDASKLRSSMNAEYTALELVGRFMAADPDHQADFPQLRRAVADQNTRFTVLLAEIPSKTPAQGAHSVSTVVHDTVTAQIERIEWLMFTKVETRDDKSDRQKTINRSIVLLGGGLACSLLLIGVFVIGFDEAGRRHAEKSLQAANEWLEAAVQDRTRELAEANHSLRVSEERLRLFVRHVPAALAMFDTDMRYIMVSRRWREDYKLGDRDLRGLSHYEVFPEISEEWKTVHRHALLGATVRNEGDRFVRSDGRVQWIRWEVLPWHDPQGNIGGIMVFSEDITDRRETEEALRYHQDLLQETGHIAKVGGWEFDVATGQGHWTEEVARIHDLDPTYPIDRDEGIKYYAPESRVRIAEAVKRAVEQGEPYDLELELISAKGARKWVRTIGHPVVVDKKVTRVRGSFQDITEHKRIEEEIRSLNAELELRVARRTAELESANRELEAFSYSVSHDLRAPLRTVDGFSQVMLEDFAPELPPAAKETLGRIRAGARRMGLLIDDLLAFSRLSRAPLTRHQVDMTGLAQSVIAELQATLGARSVKVTCPALPPAECDPALIRQVWANLLSNAFKYTGKRSAARVEIGSLTREGVVVYFVRDNGTGFDMRYAGKLFGVFQRLHRADEFEGTGVGLAIVQRIVNRHGGQVWAEAVVDQGATFFFTLNRIVPS